MSKSKKQQGSELDSLYNKAIEAERRLIGLNIGRHVLWVNELRDLLLSVQLIEGDLHEMAYQLKEQSIKLAQNSNDQPDEQE